MRFFKDFEACLFVVLKVNMSAVNHKGYNGHTNLLDGLDQPFLTLFPGLTHICHKIFAELLRRKVRYFATVICKWVSSVCETKQHSVHLVRKLENAFRVVWRFSMSSSLKIGLTRSVLLGFGYVAALQFTRAYKRTTTRNAYACCWLLTRRICRAQGYRFYKVATLL